LISFLILASDYGIPNDITQVVIEIPALSSADTMKKLEREFENIRGIKSYDGTTLNHTITLQYDASKIDKQKIEYILKKWGCTPKKYTFNKLSK
ncbi:MAG: hypothetical protein ACE5D7_06850, partial [Fidelibacterota bacterium]